MDTVRFASGYQAGKVRDHADRTARRLSPLMSRLATTTGPAMLVEQNRFSQVGANMRWQHLKYHPALVYAAWQDRASEQQITQS